MRALEAQRILDRDGDVLSDLFEDAAVLVMIRAMIAMRDHQRAEADAVAEQRDDHRPAQLAIEIGAADRSLRRCQPAPPCDA